jgi:hypothetical protein
LTLSTVSSIGIHLVSVSVVYTAIPWPAASSEPRRRSSLASAEELKELAFNKKFHFLGLRSEIFLDENVHLTISKVSVAES